MRDCPACGGNRFLDGFRPKGRAPLCPVCKGDGCMPNLTDPDVIAFGKKFEALKNKGENDDIN